MIARSDNRVCTYCGSLLSGIHDDHHCSVTGVTQPINSMGNSFYVKTKNLSSDVHLSRLSFRSVLHGYQHYKVNDRDFLLNASNYLVVQNGTKYHNEIATYGDTESIIVVFGDTMQREVELTLMKSDAFMLDNPDYLQQIESVDFAQSTYSTDDAIKNKVESIKQAILTNCSDPVFFHQAQYELLGYMINNHLKTHGQEGPDLRETTRFELYRRTRIALDYMEAHFAEKITLDTLSEVSSMSPFHFLRIFKKFYDLSPGEYLTITRLKYAKYLLEHADLPISEMLKQVGFKNHSSFSRLFKSYFDCTPTDYQALHHKSNFRTILSYSM